MRSLPRLALTLPWPRGGRGLRPAGQPAPLPASSTGWLSPPEAKLLMRLYNADGELVWEEATHPSPSGQDGWWPLSLQEQMPEAGKLVITLEAYSELYLDDWLVKKQPDILVALTDYYPFGSPMPGRRWEREKYRFGIQGWERDDEVSGIGNSYTTFFRQHDPRIGRTWSLDPKRQYPSPYTMLGNNPINGVDPDGAWFWESSNVRQARAFARETGGDFNKWRQDGHTHASVTIGGGNEKEAQVTNYRFRHGEDRSDLLREHGVGFYESQNATASGWDRMIWAGKTGDAWAAGRQGEYNRQGQAPLIAKLIAGTTPYLSLPNAASILWTGKDIYGLNASTITDRTLAASEIVVSGILPMLQAAKPSVQMLNSSEIIKKVNTSAQLTNDLGGFNRLKELENEQ